MMEQGLRLDHLYFSYVSASCSLESRQGEAGTDLVASLSDEQNMKGLHRCIASSPPHLLPEPSRLPIVPTACLDRRLADGSKHEEHIGPKFYGVNLQFHACPQLQMQRFCL